VENTARCEEGIRLLPLQGKKQIQAHRTLGGVAGGETDHYGRSNTVECAPSLPGLSGHCREKEVKDTSLPETQNLRECHAII